MKDQATGSKTLENSLGDFLDIILDYGFHFRHLDIWIPI